MCESVFLPIEYLNKLYQDLIKILIIDGTSVILEILYYKVKV